MKEGRVALVPPVECSQSIASPSNFIADSCSSSSSRFYDTSSAGHQLRSKGMGAREWKSYRLIRIGYSSIHGQYCSYNR